MISEVINLMLIVIVFYGLIMCFNICFMDGVFNIESLFFVIVFIDRIEIKI